jgi:hypothetical protein
MMKITAPMPTSTMTTVVNVPRFTVALLSKVPIGLVNPEDTSVYRSNFCAMDI